MTMESQRIRHFLFAMWMVGGVQTMFANLKEKIGKRRDISSSWLPIEMYPHDWVTKIPPISFNGSWKNSMAMKVRSRPMEKTRGDFDAAYYMEHSIITFLWGLRRRVPYLLSVAMTPLLCAEHEFWYALPKFNPTSTLSQAKHAITRSVYRGAFRLLAWSNLAKESLIRDYAIAEDQITLLPPGINIERWNCTPRNGHDVVAHPPGLGAPWQVERSRPRVLFVGWDFERKGGPLLQSLAHEPEFSNVDFHFVSSSFVGHVGPNMYVHGNLTPNSPGLVQLYRDSDIFVLPTSADLYSMVTLEAMAMRLPVIVSRVGGIPDIVDEGKTGYLVPPASKDAVRDRLRRLLVDQKLRRAFGEQGRARVEQHFNLDRHVEIVLDLLQQAAQSRRMTRVDGERFSR